MDNAILTPHKQTRMSRVRREVEFKLACAT